jgi:hypothetical protein
MAGVTETPEYQGEAGRQIMDFIGENFQKGAKWIADKTGLPASDVESYMASLSVAAPAMARPVARTVQEVSAPLVERAVIGAKMPFEPMAQARRERLSLEDYARGPQIDAAACRTGGMRQGRINLGGNCAAITPEAALPHSCAATRRDS